MQLKTSGGHLYLKMIEFYSPFGIWHVFLYRIQKWKYLPHPQFNDGAAILFHKIGVWSTTNVHTYQQSNVYLYQCAVELEIYQYFPEINYTYLTWCFLKKSIFLTLTLDRDVTNQASRILFINRLNEETDGGIPPYFVRPRTQYKRTGHWRKCKVMLSWLWFSAISKYYCQ